jgi:hypothetical protein
MHVTQEQQPTSTQTQWQLRVAEPPTPTPPRPRFARATIRFGRLRMILPNGEERLYGNGKDIEPPVPNGGARRRPSSRQPAPASGRHADHRLRPLPLTLHKGP